MESNRIIDPTIENIWKFVRGDMPTSDFEKWVYSEPTLESVFGKKLYLEIVSAHFSSKDEVFYLKETLKKFAVSASGLSCMCSQLSNTAVVDMGENSERVFLTLKEIKRRGEPYWWLSVYQCRECRQWWLVAQEERQNDVFCLHRLDADLAKELLNNNRWPSVFDKYESLLRISLEAGKSVQFFDPLNSSLRWTVSDLAKEKPGITISEIAELLNLDIGLAAEIARKVVQEDDVHIAFENVNQKQRV